MHSTLVYSPIGGPTNWGTSTINPTGAVKDAYSRHVARRQGARQSLDLLVAPVEPAHGSRPRAGHLDRPYAARTLAKNLSTSTLR
jgi:hypothetical protein